MKKTFSTSVGKDEAKKSYDAEIEVPETNEGFEEKFACVAYQVALPEIIRRMQADIRKLLEAGKEPETIKEFLETWTCESKTETGGGDKVAIDRYLQGLVDAGKDMDFKVSIQTYSLSNMLASVPAWAIEMAKEKGILDASGRLA